jgi:hypothetical protein
LGYYFGVCFGFGASDFGFSLEPVTGRTYDGFG